MEKKIDLYIKLIVILLIILVFRNWIISPEILGGDWPYFFPTILKNFNFIPPFWSEAHGNGLGSPIISYGIDTYLYLTGSIFTKYLNIPWPITYKIFWFFMIVILNFIGVSLLFNKITGNKNPTFSYLSGLIYTTNTYILMVVGGGQMGVALSYSILPFVILSFMQLIDSSDGKKNFTLRNIIYTGLFFSLQILFDPRISYLTVLILSLIYIFHVFELTGQRNLFKKIAKEIVSFISIAVISFLLNTFWVIPLILLKTVSQSAIGVTSSVRNVLDYYSFADFSKTLSLIHPNWPDNVFGKVFFMKPEFLVIPIIAFLYLIFHSNKKNIHITTFAVIAIVGAFLAKGNNPPLGLFYEVLFTKVPGFIVFRDPTKFYIMIAISYSILIPYSLMQIAREIKKKNISIFLTILFIFYWGITLTPSLKGQLGGTFKVSTHPRVYSDLSNEFDKDKSFYRTLWVPRQSRFTDPTFLHPAVEILPLLNATDAAGLRVKLSSNTMPNYLSELSIKYIVVPYDAYGEIFLNDRKYSTQERLKYVHVLDKITWLKKIKDDKLTIYTLNNKSNPLISDEFNRKINYDRISSSEYRINLNGNKSKKILFSQNYNPRWILKIGNKTIYPSKTKSGIMKYDITGVKEGGVRSLYFEGKDIFAISITISFLTLITILVFLFMLKSKNYEKS